jgi:hypothetical protein
MRGKKAKELRNLALTVFTTETRVNGSNPDQTTMYIKDMRVNKEGVKVETIGLSPVCLRYVYQQMKSTYKKGIK